MKKILITLFFLSSTYIFSNPVWVEYYIKVDSPQSAAKIVEATDNLNTKLASFFKPGNDLLGYILVVLSTILWFEGSNLRSLNILLVIIAIFWLAVKLLTKTKLFSKKESDFAKPSFKRKFKLLSFIIVILVALLVLSTAIVVNFAEDFGAEPSSHDSPNFEDGIFENLNPTTMQSDDVSTWDLLGDYLVSDDCRSPNEKLPSEKFDLIDLDH